MFQELLAGGRAYAASDDILFAVHQAMDCLNAPAVWSGQLSACEQQLPGSQKLAVAITG